MSANQDIGLQRNTIDKYYTSSKTVKKCMQLFKKHISVTDQDICIEPSAGNGSFIKKIKALFNYYIFYDIEPEHPEITKQDYLDLDYQFIFENNYNKIHIIGNPPFGRQSSWAIKFIKKSCEYCDTISFILPKSFKKDSMKKYFPLNFHLVVEYDIPDNSFLVDDMMHDVPCVFQIWEKKDINRIVPDKLLPANYRFVKKNENPDISFRRVGGNAGIIDTKINNKSPESHYFIKFDFELTQDIFDILSDINYSCKNNTVGPKSISKQELICEFNKILV